MALQILKRLQASIEPLMFFAIAAYGATLVLLEIVTFQWRPQDTTNRRYLKDRMFAKLWLILSPILYTKELDTPVPKLVSQASGTVVELGPGSGNQLPRYDKAKVKKVYGIEPNVELHDALRKAIKKQGLSDVYSIIPCGVEDTESLENYGLGAESVDSVLSIQVLCSVPQPEEMAKGLYRLLRPGGQMIVYEHVKSDDFFSHAVQQFYNILWPKVFSNCHLDRPTGNYLLQAGTWSKVGLRAPEDEDVWAVIPHLCGRLVK